MSNQPEVKVERIVDAATGEVYFEIDMDPETFSVMQCIVERCDPEDEYFAELREVFLPETHGGKSPFPFELLGGRYEIVHNGEPLTDYIRTVKS